MVMKFYLYFLQRVVLPPGYLIRLLRLPNYVKNIIYVMLLIMLMGFNAQKLLIKLNKLLGKEELILLFKVQIKILWFQ